MIHIAFAIDNNYVRHCAVTMMSVMHHNSPKNVTFHVMSKGLSGPDGSFLQSLALSRGARLELHEVAWKQVKDYEVKWRKGQLGLSVFFRCVLASLLPKSISKVLYLDSDLLVLSPLDELWATDISGCALAGVPDDFVVNPEHCRRLEYPLADNYFNGGVLLLNLDYWRKNGLENLCRWYYREHADKLLYNDQDLLNCLFHNNRVLVDMKWNVQEGAYRIPKGKTADWQPPYLEVIEHPAILHYSGRKPWQYHCMHPLRGLYWEYERIVPGLEERKEGVSRKLHRFVHFLPYMLGFKKEKYLNIQYHG